MQLIPMCSFLHRCLATSPVATAYLFRVKDAWEWLDKYLADPDPAVHLYNERDKPVEDLKDIYERLKPYFAACRGEDPGFPIAMEWNDELDKVEHSFSQVYQS